MPFRKKEKKNEGHRVIFIFQEDQIYPPPPTDFQDNSIKIVLKECFILSFIHHILRV